MVGQVEHPVGLRESMQPGVSGPGANMLEASALRPGKRAGAPGTIEDQTSERPGREHLLPVLACVLRMASRLRNAASRTSLQASTHLGGDSPACSRLKEAKRLRENALRVVNYKRAKLAKGPQQNLL